MSDSTFNLLQLETRPNWYDYLPAVEDAMADAHRTYALRTQAGWEMGEEGEWYAPDPLNDGEMLPQWEWEEFGFLFPEEEVRAADV